jgi:glycosyltransferase involved in cell wall biosynthesis
MRIRVLEVLATLKRAGAERVAVNLARGLDPARFETALVSLYDPFPGGFEPMLEEAGVRTWHLGKHRNFDRRMWPRLARLIRHFQPDVVHTHSYALRYVVPVARPKSIVHTVHNLAHKEVGTFGRLLNRLAYSRGVHPVAISGEVARSFRAVYGFEVAATVPNGIDLGACLARDARDAWRAAHGFETGDVLIVSVARLEPQKNPLALIDAFAGGLEGDARCHLLLAGAGSLQEAARQHAAARGVAGRVHFLGVCDDIAGLLAACDVFAMASEWEGRPLAVMEAMAAALPVVATRTGGVPELVEDGVDGILVSPGDSGRLAVAMASLAHDTGRRRAMGAAASAHAASFGLGAMIEGYAGLFERVAGRQR